ncbi:hypothetical protein LCGC14_0361990 [marine sediment metagenome]|uniref:Uncharacterized protein n=1 Tax=marine sediment metagenome TaxID=412755 RepID=A0A0F9VUR2_9ZZZZ
MVAILIEPPKKIFTGEPEDLAEEFRKELRTMMKAAALKMQCPVEHLKYRVDNTGTVEIQKMEPDEMAAMEIQEKQNKLRKQILKRKGLL